MSHTTLSKLSNLIVSGYCRNLCSSAGLYLIELLSSVGLWGIQWTWKGCWAFEGCASRTAYKGSIFPLSVPFLKSEYNSCPTICAKVLLQCHAKDNY